MPRSVFCPAGNSFHSAKQAGMTSALLSQALCGELSASRLHVIRRPLTSLLHFVPQQLRHVRRDVFSRRCSLCTAAARSLAAVKAHALEDTSPYKTLQPGDHEWSGLAAWRASGVDDRRHWGPKGPVAQVRQVSHPACSAGSDKYCRRLPDLMRPRRVVDGHRSADRLPASVQNRSVGVSRTVLFRRAASSCSWAPNARIATV